jgi:two-component system sensor histidine kinase MprB
VLVVATEAGEQARVLRALVRRISLIGLVVAAGAATAAWFAAGALIGPLRRLTAAAEHVSRTGNLDVPVRTDASDEAGRLSRAFAEMLAALGASQAQQQQLVDDAGHELRTPIASIRSNAEVLKRHPMLDAEVRERIADDLIGESAELTTMVNALVELAGVTASSETPEPVEVADIVQAAVRRLPTDQRDRVQVSGAAAATLRPSQLQRAVVNLLTNAAKFDPTAAPIEVWVDRGDGQVQVSVRDHGPGIAPADLPHVFARFYRAESARSVPGSGLGLAIVSDIARRNGGTVQAANHPGGGAVLTLSLPG